MKKLQCEIDPALSDAIENFGCEQEGISPWFLMREKPESPLLLCGCFEDLTTLEQAWQELTTSIADLPATHTITDLEDCDWKERYKDFLNIWEYQGLAWVPVWKQNEYNIRTKVRVLFDVGMAFGTGDHATTRLCAQRLIEYGDRDPMKFPYKRIIDAGCGSGILAITARIFGCENVYGFDHDIEAIRVSQSNRELNQLPEEAIEFKQAGIEAGLKDRSADLIMANIQADILCVYAENFVAAMAPRGTLVLSGVLEHEATECQKCFTVSFEQAKRPIKSIATRTLDGWADICFQLGR